MRAGLCVRVGVAVAGFWGATVIGVTAQETPRDTTDTENPLPQGAPGMIADVPDNRVDIGGYGSFRYELNDSDELSSGMTLRRLVVTTDARLAGRLQVYSEIEFERLSEIEVERRVERAAGGLEFEQELEGTNGSEIALEQAWAQFLFSPAFAVRFGAVLPPVGRYNLLHDDNLWNFPRRPLADRGAQVLPIQAAWTEMGLGIVGETFLGESGRLSYEAYLLNGVQLDFAIEEKVVTRVPKRNKLLLEAVVSPTSGPFDGSTTANAVSGRLAFSPALGSEYAISGYTGEYTPNFLDVDENLSTIGFDGRQKLGSFYLEGEFLYTRYSGIDNVLEDFARVAVDQATETESDETAALESEIEIELTGLSDRRYGFWLDAGRPIPLRRGFLGLESAVLIPVVRYEHVWIDRDLDEFGFAGGTVTEVGRVDREQGRLSAGFAFRPVPQAVVHLTYERNDAATGGLIDPGVGGESTNALTFGVAIGF